MARTTTADVKVIVKIRNVKADNDALAAAITTSNIVVTRVCAPHYDETLAADIALLAEIEKYLAGHFFSIFKPRREYEKAGDVAQKIETKVDLLFKVTRYGQQALMLDVSGALAVLEKRIETGGVTPSLNWLGTPLSYNWLDAVITEL